MTTVLNLGEQAAEAIRALNHRTRGADAFTAPSELSWLLADLTATAHGLPQLLGQLARWLATELVAGQLTADNDGDTDAITRTAISALSDAACHAHHLAATLDTTHQHAARLAAT